MTDRLIDEDVGHMWETTLAFRVRRADILPTFIQCYELRRLLKLTVKNSLYVGWLEALLRFIGQILFPKDLFNRFFSLHSNREIDHVACKTKKEMIKFSLFSNLVDFVNLVVNYSLHKDIAGIFTILPFEDFFH